VALFALDHNYPMPIIEQARPYLREVELVPIGDIDSRLPDLDDWELLLALHHYSREGDSPAQSTRLKGPYITWVRHNIYRGMLAACPTITLYS
jgi:hypothetical protein